MPASFTIDIDANGNVTVEGHEIAGPECTKLTDAITTALGEVTKQVKKPEFHRQAVLGRKVGH